MQHDEEVGKQKNLAYDLMGINYRLNSILFHMDVMITLRGFDQRARYGWTLLEFEHLALSNSCLSGIS